MCNEAIRQEMKNSGIFCWQLAEEIGVSESTFYRMIRHELPEDQKQKLMNAIDKVKTGR